MVQHPRDVYADQQGAIIRSEGIKNVVLVHGGFVDGSGWQGVYDLLTKDGYRVTIVQNPTLSLSDDVAVTKRALAAQDGPAILVGHSYGGAVISQAGNDPNVAALVYIAAFAPDSGESVSSLIQNPPPGAPVPPILPPVDGFLFLDRAKFHKSSHAVYVSQPKSVADLIAKASHGMTSAASRQSEETRHSRGRSRPVGVPDVICRRQTQ